MSAGVLRLQPRLAMLWKRRRMRFRRRSTSSGWIALVAVLGTAAPASATLIETMDLRALVRAADHIVLATVERTEARYDALDRIVTDATLRVEECLHGPASRGSTIVVRRLGGVLGDVGLRVEGEPSFEPGERIVLFARVSSGEGVLRPVGMSQGVLPVRHSGSGGETVLPGGEGLLLVRRGADGRLQPAPGALTGPESLDALLERIRALVAEIHGAR
jgi:hypothetical protein